jgi:hypothetical protein
VSLKYLLLFGIVAVGCLLSLHNWRRGLWLCIIVALVQDPIRKVVPGTPAFVTLAFVPIYFCMLLGLPAQRNALQELRQDVPSLKIPIVLLTAALLISFVETLTYGFRALPAACLGLFSYLGCLPALLLGYKYLQRDWAVLDRVLIGFVLLTALMLIGVPLERYDFQFSEPWLGTIAMKHNWYRWYAIGTRTEGGYVRMISGFYRSPEIMGWHAMMMVLFSIVLTMRRRGWAFLWGLTALWGMYGVMLSGRRKMFLMILVFIAIFILKFRSWQRTKFWLPAGACLAMLAAGLIYIIDDDYLAAAETGLPIAGGKALEKGIFGPLWLIWVVGPFGYGLGTCTQGAQHLDFSIRTPQLEGGFERVMIEIGIVGTVAAVLVTGIMARALVSSAARSRTDPEREIAGTALLALVGANAAGFVIAFQLFGDPFIVVLISFLAGILLSLPRVIGRMETRPSATGPAAGIPRPQRLLATQGTDARSNGVSEQPQDSPLAV